MGVARIPCPRCGKLLHPAAIVCPNCGANTMAHKRRFRCGHCGRRVPVDVTRCPYCLADPRRFYFRPRHLLIMLALFALGAGAILIAKVPPWLQASSPTKVALVPAATNTPAPPVVVPAAITAIATQTPVPTTAATFTETPTPSDTPTLTANPTSTPSSTPLPTTRPLTRVPTLVVIAPPPTWTPVPPNPPLPFAPADGEIFIGPRKSIPLVFQPVEILHTNQWHRVQVDYLDATGWPTSWCGWTIVGSINFPGDYYFESSPYDRAFRWHVNIAQAFVDNPSTCAAPATIISPPSVERTFNWY